MEEIPFTDELVEKLRNGEKSTTMRTVKRDNLYRVGERYQVADDLTVKVQAREVITFGPEICEAYDNQNELFPNEPAKHDALRTLEGFDSIGEMLEWFRSRNYDLPQPFFLYKLNPLETPEEGDA